MQQSRFPLLLSTALCVFTTAVTTIFCEGRPFRPPSVPLVVNDPFMSVWSGADALYDTWPTHWTGQVKAICGLIRVDGRVYRWCGPAGGPPVAQRSLTVKPLTTEYTFGVGGVVLTVSFLSPCLPGRADLATRPVTYLALDVRVEDGQLHDVELYVDISAEWAVSQPEQLVAWQTFTSGGVNVHMVQRKEQTPLSRSGDRCYIDWGSAFLASPQVDGVRAFAASHQAARQGFRDRTIPGRNDLKQPRAARDDWPVFGFVMDLGRVGGRPAERLVLFGYDDEWSVEFFGQKLRPWWRKRHGNMAALLADAAGAHKKLRDQSDAADDALLKTAHTLGGEAYAHIVGLAYRQALAAGKAVIAPDGGLYYFSKEISSNGCMSTVDATYPSSPFFLTQFPELLAGLLAPVLHYASTDAWTYAWAPHDLGCYPLARGQAYGGHMPVEESGNMLILLAALSRLDGHDGLAKKYWPLLTQWADYLVREGADPGNQLCTDDFTGHLARNANLSLKACSAVAAYASLGERIGRPEAAAYRRKAEAMKRFWEKHGLDGDHYRLAFDAPRTWSMKYNLIWDKVLDLGLFPAKVAQTELAYYRRLVQPYGLPLDNRATFTKADWLVWMASLEPEPEGFKFWLAPLVRFLNETPDRVPFTDWYDTIDPRTKGMFCRPVIGGVFMRFLADQ